jgi:hypothetical protein
MYHPTTFILNTFFRLDFDTKNKLIANHLRFYKNDKKRKIDFIYNLS